MAEPPTDDDPDYKHAYWITGNWQASVFMDTYVELYFRPTGDIPLTMEIVDAKALRDWLNKTFPPDADTQRRAEQP